MPADPRSPAGRREMFLRDARARWLALSFLCGIVAYYGVAAAAAVFRPWNSGWDWVWAAVTLAAFTLSAAASITSHGHRIFTITCGLAALCATSSTILSRSIVPVLAVAWIAILAFLLGFLTNYALTRELRISRANVPTLLALGLGEISLVMLVLGIAGLLRIVPVILVMAGLTVAAGLVGHRLGVFRRLRSPRWSDHERGFVLFAVYILLLSFFWALAPELQYDALNYQLPVPRDYLEAGRIIDLPHYWHSYFAHLVNLLFALGLLFGGVAGAKLLVVLMSAIAALGVYACALRIAPRQGAAAAALLFLSTPLTIWLTSTAYVDNPVAMFLTASMIPMLRSRPGLGHMVVAGLLAGFAVGTKPNAAYAVGAIAFCFAVLEWRRPLRMAGRLAAYSIAAAVSAIPAYALVFSFTGNPVYPLYSNLFPGGRPSQVESGMNFFLFGVGETPLALLSIPLRSVWDARFFGEALLPGALGATMALLPLAVAIAPRLRKRHLFILGSVLLYSVAWAFTAQYGRYYVPVLGLAAACVIGACRRIAGLSRPAAVLIFVVSGMQVVAVPPLFWAIRERIPVKVALGVETREAFLLRAMPQVAAVQHVNQVIRRGASVLGIGVDSLRFYLKAPLLSLIETVDVGRVLAKFEGEDLEREFMRRRWHFVIRDNRSPHAGIIGDAWLEEHARPDYTVGEILVYEIGAGLSAETGRNLLANASFESIDDSGSPTDWMPAATAEAGDQFGRNGTVGVRVTADSGLTQTVAACGGCRYALVQHIRSPREGEPARLQINWLDASGQLLRVDLEVVLAREEWSRHQLRAPAPAHAVQATIHASVHGTGPVFFDDMWFGREEP